MNRKVKLSPYPHNSTLLPGSRLLHLPQRYAESTIAMSNLTHFYWQRWETAVQSFHNNDVARSREICYELVGESSCPRFRQIRAYQLLSLCTQDREITKAELEKALELLHSLDVDDAVMAAEYRKQTVSLASWSQPSSRSELRILIILICRRR